MQYNNDGILLIDKPLYLKENVISMTSDELKEKIEELNESPQKLQESGNDEEK
jgi:hypothetical protein